MFVHTVNSDTSLKLFEIRDADALFRLTDASRAYLREWLPWVDGTRTAEDSRMFIQLTLEQFASNNGFQSGIWWKGQLVGGIGFHNIDWSNRKTSIGYWIGQGFQGNGIMTSATRALVDVAFDYYGLNRVEIRAAKENHRSRAIPERLGFLNEGCVRQAEWLYDHFVDHVIYGMVSAEWTT
ncbi:GNAT family N-acetyltransferase [Alicyclobacillus fastidiosus]|uniref:GNAT family protein n=1 Tax=Alicyclobacillus fastidiosus TaxID=392011 RepID=A0ABV5AAD9_9BACL|nr:GNAT family protein [Alicyclobacillus fastidiosus]WEH07688.1 GNAT family protein [Alicyclobacillus fastidiosus]